MRQFEGWLLSVPKMGGEARRSSPKKGKASVVLDGSWANEHSRQMWQWRARRCRVRNTRRIYLSELYKGNCWWSKGDGDMHLWGS